MKIVLNRCFGGYGISDKFPALQNRERTDPVLIEWVERDSKAVSGYCAKLEVIEIPDTATDYEINDYDGMETLIYVVDGKIHWS